MSHRRQRGFEILALTIPVWSVSCKPEQAPQPPPQESPAIEATASRWVQRLVPPQASGRSRLFFDSISRVVVVYESGVRREVTKAGSDVGLDFPTMQIWGMAESDSGALWLMQDGTVLRSPSATGPMERVDGLDAGSVAVVEGMGYACTNAGDLVSIAMQGAPRPRSQGQPCTSVAGTSTSLAIEHPAGVWSPTTEPEEDWRRTSWSSFRRPWGAAPDAVDRADRLITTWRDRTGFVYSVGPALVAHAVDADGVWTQLQAPRGMSCTFLPSAHALVASCRGRRDLASPAHRLFAYQGDWVQSFASTRGRHDPEIRVRVSRTDGSAVLDHACDLGIAIEPRDETEAFPLCIIDDQQDAHSLPRWAVPPLPAKEEKGCDEDAAYDVECDPYATVEPSEHPFVRDFQPPYLLTRRAESDVHIIDVRTGAAALPNVRGCQDAWWAGPGWLACRRVDTSNNAVVLHRVEDETARPVSLPDAALSVAFASANRGVAAGRTAEALWTTTDGGATWNPVELEIDGHLSHLQLEPARCTNVVCSARPFVWADEEILRRFDLPQVGYFAPSERAPTPEAPR